jgi:hypothetical protein
MRAARRAASRRPSAAQLIAKIRSSTMGATVTVRAQALIAGMTRRSRTGSGSEHRTAYLDLFLGGAGNPPQATSRVRASASQARTVASNGRYATSRGADTSGKQSRFRPFGRLRRRAESSRLLRSQAPLDREDRRAINLNGLIRHAGNLGQLPGLVERERGVTPPPTTPVFGFSAADIIVETSSANKAWVGFAAPLGPSGGTISVFGAFSPYRRRRGNRGHHRIGPSRT